MKEFFKFTCMLMLIVAELCIAITLIRMLITCGIVSGMLAVSLITATLPVLVKLIFCSGLFLVSVVSIGGVIFLVYDLISEWKKENN